MQHDKGSAGYQSQQILDHVVGLLDRWGECMRKERAAGARGHGQNTVAMAMDQWGERSKRERKKRNPAAYQNTKRKVQVGEGRDARWVPVLDLLEQPVKETKSWARPIMPPWPEDVQWTERLLARMPRDLLHVMVHHHYYQSSMRVAAGQLKISVHEYRQRKERAHWLVAGQLLSDAG